MFYDAFEPGPEPRKVRERRAQIDQDRETNKQNLSRSVKQAPDAESAEDAERFPGGIVPSALPKKRMGGRLRGRRR